MDLRKHFPVQNENPPPPVKGSKKAFFQLIGGLAAVIALLFSMQSNYHPKPNAPKPVVSQKVSEVVNQSKNKIFQNSFDILNQGNSKLRQNASNVIAQRSKPQRVAPASKGSTRRMPKPTSLLETTNPA